MVDVTADRLAGLRAEEQVACVVAERVLDATARPFDVGGHPGGRRVDAVIDLPGGRSAAFEVTGLFSTGTRAVAGRLGRESHRWDAAGRWFWRVEVGAEADLRRLHRVYRRVAGLCEAAGVDRPERLLEQYPNPGEVDADVWWLVDESSSRMWGFPSIPSGDGERDRGTSVTRCSVFGFPDLGLVGLGAVLREVFAWPNVARHLAKLAAHAGPVDERHLFLWIDPLDTDTPMPFDVGDGLASGTTVPPDPPELPVGITHLWLAPVSGGRVLVAGPGGWSQHHPYDER